MRELRIEGLSKRQKMIAQLLWNCPSRVEVDMLCRAGGPEFYTMRDLILATALDEIEDTDLAEIALV